jgi:hypothetical protein
MKLCWDNIENIRLTKNGNFRDITKCVTYKLKICKNCKEEFLSMKGMNLFCSLSCSSSGKNNGMYGKHHTNNSKKMMSENSSGVNNYLYGKHLPEETKRKISESNRGDKGYWYGKHFSEETKKKMSKSRKGLCCGNKHPSWKGGIKEKQIPLYDTYAPQIDWCEEVRRSPKDQSVLEVKCAYCGRWFISSTTVINRRIQALKGQMEGECRFYCSEYCKKACPLYNKSPQTLMKEDAVRAGRFGWLELNREAQPELRQMVLARDDYTCQKCGLNGPLHCHHILPAATNPIESADVDNCITLCEECHKKVHKIPGCGYNEIRMEIC